MPGTHSEHQLYRPFGTAHITRVVRIPPTISHDRWRAGQNYPVLSPLYADLKGFPPSLFLTSERDMMLSGTTILHRAFLRAGVDARLVVFEGLPHGFWNGPYLPESKEADRLMASFFERELTR